MEHTGLEIRDVRILVNFTAKRGSGAGAIDVIFSVFKDTGSGFAVVNSNTNLAIELDNKARGGTMIVRDRANTGDKYSVYVSQPSTTITINVPTLQLDLEAM